MTERPCPDLLSAEENKALLTRAEELWAQLQENRLGGYSDGNRPFWIHAEFKSIIEAFGRRDVGLTWTKNELDARKAEQVARAPALIDAIEKAVGEMPAFPGDNIGMVDTIDDDEPRTLTLNEWMANTWIADRWAGLRRRAAEAAAAVAGR